MVQAHSRVHACRSPSSRDASTLSCTDTTSRDASAAFSRSRSVPRFSFLRFVSRRKVSAVVSAAHSAARDGICGPPARAPRPRPVDHLRAAAPPRAHGLPGQAQAPVRRAGPAYAERGLHAVLSFVPLYERVGDAGAGADGVVGVEHGAVVRGRERAQRRAHGRHGGVPLVVHPREHRREQLR